MSRPLRHDMLTVVSLRRRRVDPVYALFIGMFLGGLLLIGATVWAVHSRVSALPPVDEAPLRALQSAWTRDAQAVELSRLRGKLERLQSALATAYAGQTAVAATVTACPASPSPRRSPLALIWDVPLYRQRHRLSCEPCAAAMAAAYYGLETSEEEILAALPRHENPHRGFRGNVDGPYGGIVDYGVYAGPLQQVLLKLGLHAEIMPGDPHPVERIRDYIRQERLVIAWVTFDLQVQAPRRVMLTNGESVVMVPYEHTVLVVGYNRDGLWVNDPYSGTRKFYPQGEFARSFSYLGQMALVVGRRK